MQRLWLFTPVVLLLCLLAWWLMQPEETAVADNTGIEPTSTGDVTRRPAQTPPRPASATDTAKPGVVTPEKSAAVPDNTIDLRGSIVDSAGSVVGGIEIEIESRGLDGEEIQGRRSRSNDSGEFVLRGIVPGRQYRLEVRPQGDYAAYSLDSFTSDDSKALERIVLKQVKLVDVDGMIVDTGFAPVADFELTVRSLSTEYPDRVIRSDSSGFFSLPAFPAGEIRIATTASDYYRIKGIELKPDEYRNLTLMIDRGNHHLSGWVGDENGAPLEDVQITIKSAFAADDYHSFSYRTGVTDASGGFEFAGLGGHRLTLGIYARGYESLIRQHEFESFADRIELRLQRQRPKQADENAAQQ